MTIIKKTSTPGTPATSTRRKHFSICQAIVAKDLEDIKAWIHQRRDGFDPLHAFDGHGFSPLDRAVQTGDVSLVRFLIDQGVNVNLADKNGMTSMHFAAQTGALEALKLLVEHGANIHLKLGLEQDEPLYFALCGGHTEVAAFLLRAGSSVNVKNSSNEGYLSVVLSRGGEHMEAMVQVLLDHGIENAEIKSGYQLALRQKQFEIASQLGRFLAQEERAALEVISQESMTQKNMVGVAGEDSSLTSEKCKAMEGTKPFRRPKTL